MTYAVETMSPTIKAVFFGLAVVAFVLTALGVGLARVGLLAAGLGLFAFPFFWDQLALA